MKISTTRTETFSDGVMAIIITIMALEILPEVKADVSNQEVIDHLLKLLPKFVAYVLSFLMISILWINHHHMFHLLEGTDEGLLLQNLFFLFWISLIPMATSTLGANPFAEISVALYGFIMLMTTLSLTLMRVRIRKQNLVHKDQDKNLTKKINKVSLKAKTKSLIGTLSYLLSIPLAFVNIYASFICFLIPPIIFFIPDGIDDEKLAEKIAEKN